MTHTHRVVVVYSDKPGFNGASGVYATKLEAQGALLDVARTWVGLGDVALRADGSIVVTTYARTVTYSILTERAAPAFEGTPFGTESEPVEHPNKAAWARVHSHNTIIRGETDEPQPHRLRRRGL